jgi:hypothetical protein
MQKYHLRNSNSPLVKKLSVLFSSFDIYYYYYYYGQYPTPVALRSKAQVCSVSIAGIAVSNPVEGMDVRHLFVHCTNADVAFYGPQAISCRICNAGAGFSSWTVPV